MRAHLIFIRIRHAYLYASTLTVPSKTSNDFLHKNIDMESTEFHQDIRKIYYHLKHRDIRQLQFLLCSNYSHYERIDLNNQFLQVYRSINRRNDNVTAT